MKQSPKIQFKTSHSRVVKHIQQKQSLKPKPMSNLLQILKNVFSSNVNPEQAVISEQKEIASKLYPENTEMQNYIVHKQLSAYRHIQTVNDIKIKDMVTQKYPSNYTMQQHTYQQQLSAKDYMNTTANTEIKVEAERKYPNDYFAQKYVYDSGNMSA